MECSQVISIEKRAQVVILIEEGYTQCEIARRLQMNQSSVSRIAKKQKEVGTVRNLKRTGRPRKSNERDDKMLKRAVTKNPFVTSAVLKSEFPHISLSSRSIRRRLSVDLGLVAHKPCKKPLLSKKNIKDRLNFCKKYKHWSKEDWRRVMFSDESTFLQFGVFQKYVRRPVNSRFDPKFMIRTVKHSPSLMVWAAFSYHGRGPIQFIEPGTTVNAKSYLNIIQNKLPVHMAIHQCSIYQQDGATCHQAGIVRKWLRDSRIDVLDWPGNSPDINPIENLWTLVKKKVQLRRPDSILDLKHAIRSVWVLDVNKSLCEKLIDSLPTRINLILKARGQPIKY